ncbi:hypothetical protein SPRG_00013 [Saprolegnia parasitica CBS 223.65]|uniref:Uncharacterized protein n=1 Tax=Saprolegnia parasitica (strain CBS 223.65) TaxID=695850 RepID=A0A067D861_SAPPC|nr:hypothetical protein SPRG_00013 [Saprolegnia parasitica CBS 223.65]KDO35167.1 hypothetical protein SPRG_00013 [Saprolegnia parasitica CBS 223.65]|eukprot:XP_012193519.1 hypothetical protein SPRG_00013 [Saprolegnia parasitica CBS 223.65]
MDLTADETLLGSFLLPVLHDGSDARMTTDNVLDDAATPDLAYFHDEARALHADFEAYRVRYHAMCRVLFPDDDDDEDEDDDGRPAPGDGMNLL